MPSVSVILPARNDAASLEKAVQSALVQADGLVAEIVLAIAPSTDGTEAEAERLATLYPAVRVVANPAGKTPNALNLAIAASTGDVIVRVDARSQLPVDYIANALETMAETGAANVGAIQHPVGATPTQRGIAAAMRSRLGSGGVQYRGSDHRQRVDTAYLGVFKRAALIEVGGYDESFDRNQDAELNERLNRAGHEVWVDPRLVVDYLPRGTVGALSSQYWQYGWWRRRTVRKHRRSLRFRQLLPPVALVIGTACVLLAFWWPWLAAMPSLYVVAVLGVAFTESALTIAERLVMAAALVTMHVSWAAGFLASSVGLVFRRQ